MAQQLKAITEFISNVGFPIFVAVVLLYNQREMHRENVRMIRRMAQDVAKLRASIRKKDA